MTLRTMNNNFNKSICSINVKILQVFKDSYFDKRANLMQFQGCFKAFLNLMHQFLSHGLSWGNLNVNFIVSD